MARSGLGSGLIVGFLGLVMFGWVIIHFWWLILAIVIVVLVHDRYSKPRRSVRRSRPVTRSPVPQAAYSNRR